MQLLLNLITTVLLADTLNNKVVKVGVDGTWLQLPFKGSEGAPLYAEAFPLRQNGDTFEFQYVVVSKGAVCMINVTGDATWCYREPPPFNPTHATYIADPTGDGLHVLITDMGGNRTLVVDPADNRIVWQYGPETGGYALKSPRMATPLASGRVLIADTGNRRILTVAPPNKNGKYKPLVFYTGTQRFRDFAPTFITQYADGMGRLRYLVLDEGDMVLIDLSSEFDIDYVFSPFMYPLHALASPEKYESVIDSNITAAIPVAGTATEDIINISYVIGEAARGLNYVCTGFFALRGVTSSFTCYY
jgi:hypothetical protein